jgi:predicted nucleic acid-binding protein
VGPLNLPSSGTVYLDAQIIIYSVERRPSFWPKHQGFWKSVQNGQIKLCSSELSLLEALVEPIRSGDSVREQEFHTFFVQPSIELIPITRPILLAAARVRASTPKIKGSDAIHVATAQALSCDHVLTNDLEWRAVAGLPVVLL